MSNKYKEINKKADKSDLKTTIFKMVSVGVVDDRLNQSYDIISTVLLLLNITCSFLASYDNLSAKYGSFFHVVEVVTVFFFLIDYILRLYTSDRLYPDASSSMAAWRYIRSGAGIIDLLSFLPYYLPVFFPAGTVVFRLFRVARIFRLFRVNNYYDSLNVITDVLSSKKNQLLSSVFIIFVMMMASSLCMYSLEHQAQPDVFKNAFSGIWWAASTLLTVGYGDIYPVTLAGQVVGTIITFLGVGMVAIPTGIISAGFVEHYQELKRQDDVAEESNTHFIEVKIGSKDIWRGKKIKEIGIPKEALIAAVIRNNESLIPNGDLVIEHDDKVIICAESMKSDHLINMKEITLRAKSPWVGSKIKDLDISRQAFIVHVERNGRNIIPSGNLVLREGDVILMYSNVSIKEFLHEGVI